MLFDFMDSIPQMEALASACERAERLYAVDASSSSIASRRAMETTAKLIYRAAGGDPSGMTVFEVMTDSRFVDYLKDETLITALHTIRKIGNRAAHEGAVSKEEALDCLEQLHYLMGELCISMGLVDDYPEFVEPGEMLTATVVPSAGKEDGSGIEMKAVEAVTAASDETQEVVLSPEIEALFADRLRYTSFDTTKHRDELSNKKKFVAASLREAGWPIVSVPGQVMPNSVTLDCKVEDGRDVDYVLTGPDGRPLAVVDMSVTLEKGPIEARKYLTDLTQSMKQSLGYAPMAYYTEGYKIYCLDQLGYPFRRVFTFHSVDEMLVLKQRGQEREDISNPEIRDEITNRDYQKEAIRATCDALAQGRRSSLLVMATGTGKTRVSISLVDVLMKANWVKNVLFLADRKSLVRQAHKNFTKLLPNVTTSVYLGDSTERDQNARIIFSTYQTMLSLVDDDTREFGIGRFDLIIIDEAHRSIFNKYGALFKYFDSLMIGLTATPRNEENKSTYDVFSLQNGKPDFAYELKEAIGDGYLVGFAVQDRTLERDRRGSSYDELSDEEKQRLEDILEDAGVDDVGADLSNSYVLGTMTRVINKGSIRAMLADLMENGIKVDAGDKLGKTIIFAKSHKEAELIVEVFQSEYESFDPDFCKLIDSQAENSQTLIDRFGERDSLPQIAVSVDMLDTGIDVPDAVNLVFYKTVRSKIKFLQMVGRGTRLSPDLFGPGMDKRGFFVFDYYDNFRYFSTGNMWSTLDDKPTAPFYRSQSAYLDSKRLQILRQLQTHGASNEFEKKYEHDLYEYFVISTRDLCNDRLEVESNMQIVNKYRMAENWDSISSEAAHEIEARILPLFPPEKGNQKAKSFDGLIYAVESVYKEREAQGKDLSRIHVGFTGVGSALSSRMEALLKLKTIPDVLKKEKLISSMIDGQYLFEDFSLERAEYVRTELRELMQYIPDRKEYFIIDLPDRLIEEGTAGGKVEMKSYADKAMSYINESGDPSLAKLSALDKLSAEEAQDLWDVFTYRLGTPADFSSWSGFGEKKTFLPFLRRIVGISDDAIVTKFGSFYNETALSPVQYAYMEQIVDYAKENGDITALDLQNSPFDKTPIIEVFPEAEQIDKVKQLITGLHSPVSWQG